MTSDGLRRFYRWQFTTAAIYNVVWGAAVSLFPREALNAVGFAHVPSEPLFQAIGMMVATFGYGYWLLAKDPVRFYPYVWIGIAGKTLGPIGLIWSVSQGRLPLSFGWVCVFNDLIWQPGFWLFAIRERPTNETASSERRIDS